MKRKAIPMLKIRKKKLHKLAIVQVVVQTVTEFAQFRVNWLHRVNWFTAAHHHRYHFLLLSTPFLFI